MNYKQLSGRYIVVEVPSASGFSSSFPLLVLPIGMVAGGDIFVPNMELVEDVEGATKENRDLLGELEVVELGKENNEELELVPKLNTEGTGFVLAKKSNYII